MELGLGHGRKKRGVKAHEGRETTEALLLENNCFPGSIFLRLIDLLGDFSKTFSM